MPRKWKTKAEKDAEYVPQVTQLLYSMIGRRIRQRRKDMDKSLMDISADMGIDYTLLSRIERGLISTKNPYLLSAMQITAISGQFGIEAADLIWGTREEQISLLKVVTAAVLLNGAGNPFYNGNMAAQYERLHMVHCPDYERESNLLLKQLLLHSDYAGYFFHYLQNCCEFDPQRFRVLAEGFLLNKGNFSDFLLDRQNHTCFAAAFSTFWERVENDYLDFFRREYFSSSADLCNKGLHIVTNQRLHDVLVSPGFAELNQRLLLMAEYTDGNATAASVQQRLSIFAMLHKGDAKWFPGDEVLTEQ